MCNDSTAKQVLYGIWPQRKRATKEHSLEKRDPAKEMWTAGYKYSWRKMEAAA